MSLSKTTWITSMEGVYIFLFLLEKHSKLSRPSILLGDLHPSVGPLFKFHAQYLIISSEVLISGMLQQACLCLWSQPKSSFVTSTTSSSLSCCSSWCLDRPASLFSFPFVGDVAYFLVAYILINGTIVVSFLMEPITSNYEFFGTGLLLVKSIVLDSHSNQWCIFFFYN